MRNDGIDDPLLIDDPLTEEDLDFQYKDYKGNIVTIRS